MAREDGIHKIEVHVAGLCFEKVENVWKCLIARRTETRSLYPGLWECGGGQVQPGETFEKALARQMKEEFGIDPRILAPFGCYSIESKDALIPGIKFICLLEGKSSIELDPREHTDYVWVAKNDIGRYDFIPGVEKDLENGFREIDRLSAKGA